MTLTLTFGQALKNVKEESQRSLYQISEQAQLEPEIWVLWERETELPTRDELEELIENLQLPESQAKKLRAGRKNSLEQTWREVERSIYGTEDPETIQAKILEFAESLAQRHSFGSFLRGVRRERSRTIQDCATRVGVEEELWQRWEADEILPNFGQLKLLNRMKFRLTYGRQAMAFWFLSFKASQQRLEPDDLALWEDVHAGISDGNSFNLGLESDPLEEDKEPSNPLSSIEKGFGDLLRLHRVQARLERTRAFALFATTTGNWWLHWEDGDGFPLPEELEKIIKELDIQSEQVEPFRRAYSAHRLSMRAYSQAGEVFEFRPINADAVYSKIDDWRGKP